MFNIKNAALEQVLHYATTPANQSVAGNEVENIENIDGRMPADESATPAPEDTSPSEVHEEALLEALVSETAVHCDEESDIAQRLRELGFWRNEALALMEKAVANNRKAFLDRAVAIINCELDLLEKKLAHPEQFDTPEEVPDFGLRFVGKNTGLSIIGITELVLGICLSEEVLGPNGKPASLMRLAKAFEYFLGINFGSIYKQCDAIFDNRKSYNRTKALDYLRTLILLEEKRRLKEKKKKEDG